MSTTTVPIWVSDEGLCFTRCLLAWDPDFDVSYFLEKPWKWAPEYAIWLDNGRPSDEHDDAFERVTELWDEL